MTDENERDPERKLTALFDRSAPPLSDVDRAKFLRRASDLGSVAQRAPPGAPYIWIPALAVAAAVVYLVVPKRHVEPAEASPSPSPPSVSVAGEDSPPASAVAAEPAEVPDPEDLVTTILAGDPSELEPLDLGPLMVEAERAQSDREHDNLGRVAPELPERSKR
jgi:hypothetical protein